MAKFKVTELDQWKEFKTADDETVRLKVRPPGRTVTVEADAIISFDRTRTAEAEDLLRRSCITDWKDVDDEHGKSLDFSHGDLDTILGADRILGDAVTMHLFTSAGLYKGEEPAPLADESEPSPPSTSNADSSPEKAVSPSSV